jgi:hypothetical protein
MYMRIKKTLFSLCTGLIFASSLSVNGENQMRENPMRENGNPTILSEPIGGPHLDARDDGYDFLEGGGPSLFATRVGDDGRVSVGYATNTHIFVREYTMDLKHIKTMAFEHEWSLEEMQRRGSNVYVTKTGNPPWLVRARAIDCIFTKDGDGNYYFFYARPEDKKDVENLAVVKYDSLGQKLKTFRLKAGELNALYVPPEQNSIEVSGNRCAVFFGRNMFVNPSDGINHGGSTGFVIDKNSFERLNEPVQNISHSMGRYLLPTDGGFVFVDHCDTKVAPNRAFTFSKIADNVSIRRKTAFQFKLGTRPQQTFARMAGLAQTHSGYLFAGAYEKSDAVSIAHNDSRNLFVLTMDNSLGNIGNPIWITDYTDKRTENVGSPKIVGLGDGRILLMWELMGYGYYRSAYMAIIDETGKRLTDIRELPAVRLNTNYPLRYNKANGNVYWAVNGPDMNTDIYSFNPDKPIQAPARAQTPKTADGLTLLNFTAEKNAAPQNEMFAVKAQFYNRLPHALTGSIGAALVDNNGRIVEIIGSSPQKTFSPIKYGYETSLNSGYSRSSPSVAINCIVPEKVKPGAYGLRLAYKTSGEDDWEIVALKEKRPLVSRGVQEKIPMAEIDIVTSIPFTVSAGRTNLDGYGLMLANFAVRDGRASAAHGEKFPITLKAAKVGAGAFPAGQIGVALVNSKGNIVEVINTRDWSALESGEQRSQNMSTVSVPKSVAVGRYRLMVVARPAGGEWKVVTMALDGVQNGIDFTVR